MASAEQRSTVWSRAVKLVKTVRLPLAERISLPESVISTGLLEQLAAAAFGDEGMLAKLSKEKPEYSEDHSRKEATVIQLQSHGLQRNARSVLNGDEHSVYEAVKIAVDNLPSSMLIAEKEGAQHNESTDVHKNDDGLLLLDDSSQMPSISAFGSHSSPKAFISSTGNKSDKGREAAETQSPPGSPSTSVSNNKHVKRARAELALSQSSCSTTEAPADPPPPRNAHGDGLEHPLDHPRDENQQTRRKSCSKRSKKEESKPKRATIITSPEKETMHDPIERHGRRHYKDAAVAGKKKLVQPGKRRARSSRFRSHGLQNARLDPAGCLPGNVITAEQIDEVERWLERLNLGVNEAEHYAPLLDNPLRNGVLLCKLVSAVCGKHVSCIVEPPLSIVDARHNVIAGQKALVQEIPVIPTDVAFAFDGVLRGDSAAIYGLLWFVMSSVGGDCDDIDDFNANDNNFYQHHLLERDSEVAAQPQWHTRYKLPYSEEDVRELERVIVHFLHYHEIVPLPSGPDMFKTVIEHAKSGLLLCELVEAIEQKPVRGVYSEPRNRIMASSNVQKAQARLLQHGNMSKRFLNEVEPVINGDRHFVLGLLEDVHRWAHNMPLKPGHHPMETNQPNDASHQRFDKPYLPAVDDDSKTRRRRIDSIRKRRRSNLGDDHTMNEQQHKSSLSRAALATSEMRWKAKASQSSSEKPTEHELQDVSSFEDATERISQWLRSLGLRSWQLYSESELPTESALAHACSNGTLLFDLLQTLEGVHISAHTSPKTSAQRLWNAEKALQAFRMQPRLAVRHLYSARSIARGHVRTIVELLDDVRTCPLYRRRWRTIRFYNNLSIERKLTRGMHKIVKDDSGERRQAR